jgi:hypothetical protein
MRRLAVLVSPLVLLAAAGCSSDEASPAGEAPPSQMTLAEAQSAWEARGPTTYRMTLVSTCGNRAGLGTYAVKVTPDETTATGVDRWSLGTDVQTVPDLFAFIAEVTDGGAEVVDTTYNPSLGYPEKVSVDYTVDSTDDEECYTVKDFRPAKPTE